MTITSLSVSGLMTINLHALNNEGSEGNYLQTRQVQIVDQNGRLHTVNAISGDMLKHIQGEHLYQLALENNLPLCDGCQNFDANRIVVDQTFAGSFPKDTSDGAILDGAIKRCTLDDTQGILITSEIGGKKRAIGRKSILEFGWAVGRPESTVTESYFHVKFVPEGRGKGSGDENGANTGQNIFHRPASSGQYAMVLNVDLFRLGRNDITMSYALDEKERIARIKVLLQSILYTFLKPSGAHRNTQNPHIVDFQGVLTMSDSSIPAPVTSALNSNYLAETEKVAAVLNKIKKDSIKMKSFNSIGEFTEIMGELIVNLEA